MEEPKAGCTQKDGVGSEKLKGVQSKKKEMSMNNWWSLVLNELYNIKELKEDL
jgi:hypothetical protein